MKHKDLCRVKDEAKAAADIDDGKAAIEKVAGVRTIWFRTPYGARCDRVEKLLAERGLDALPLGPRSAGVEARRREEGVHLRDAGARARCRGATSC